MRNILRIYWRWEQNIYSVFHKEMDIFGRSQTNSCNLNQRYLEFQLVMLLMQLRFEKLLYCFSFILSSTFFFPSNNTFEVTLQPKKLIDCGFLFCLE